MTHSQGSATIAPGIAIKGKIRGSNDLVVQGEVEGNINLPNNVVVIAGGSTVNADVKAQSIQVEGTVRGKLVGKKEITIGSGGVVEGDISAPTVSIQNGARFDGSIDMPSPGSKSSNKVASESAKQ